MNSFRNQRLRDHVLHMSTAWLFNDIAEAKGKQELFTRQSPQVLKALCETAIIQSSESSNRIEGVTVAPDLELQSHHAILPLMASASYQEIRDSLRQ